MKMGQKVAIGVGAAIVLGGMVWFSVYQVNKGMVSVQSGQVVRQDLTSIVTASGEIRPKNYTNVLGEGFGKITDRSADQFARPVVGRAVAGYR